MRILPVSIKYGQSVHSATPIRDYYATSPAQACDSVHFSGKNVSAKQIIILLGAPNSGKGTCAKKIAQKYSIPQISTGDILRKEVKELTDLGKKAKDYMNSGALVPDSLIMDIFKKRINQPDCAKGFILDGFPRTIEQAKQLDEVLKGIKDSKLKVVNLDVDKAILYSRSASRYTCKDCSSTYTIKEGYNPETSKCTCGGQLVKRADDTPEVLTKRLENYDKQTFPLIDYYGSKVKHVRVHDENAPAEQTFSRVVEKIEESK